MKKIYIIITQTGTRFSKLLKGITREPYNHASICLQDDFQTFYSFGRKNPKWLLPAGLVIENACQGVFALFAKIPCIILEKEVSEEQYQALSQNIHYFMQHQSQYSYAILSLIFADMPFSVVQKNRFFCSQFVAKLLNDIDISTIKSPEHMHPADFMKIEGIRPIFEGDLKMYCQPSMAHC